MDTLKCYEMLVCSADVLTVEKPNKARKIPEVPTQNRYFGHVISHVRGK